MVTCTLKMKSISKQFQSQKGDERGKKIYIGAFELRPQKTFCPSCVRDFLTTRTTCVVLPGYNN